MGKSVHGLSRADFRVVFPVSTLDGVMKIDNKEDNKEQEELLGSREPRED